MLNSEERDQLNQLRQEKERRDDEEIKEIETKILKLVEEHVRKQALDTETNIRCINSKIRTLIEERSGLLVSVKDTITDSVKAFEEYFRFQIVPVGKKKGEQRDKVDRFRSSFSRQLKAIISTHIDKLQHIQGLTVASFGSRGPAEGDSRRLVPAVSQSSSRVRHYEEVQIRDSYDESDSDDQPLAKRRKPSIVVDEQLTPGEFNSEPWSGAENRVTRPPLPASGRDGKRTSPSGTLHSASPGQHNRGLQAEITVARRLRSMDEVKYAKDRPARHVNTDEDPLKNGPSPDHSVTSRTLSLQTNRSRPTPSKTNRSQIEGLSPSTSSEGTKPERPGRDRVGAAPHCLSSFALVTNRTKKEEDDNVCAHFGPLTRGRGSGGSISSSAANLSHIGPKLEVTLRREPSSTPDIV